MANIGGHVVFWTAVDMEISMMNWLRTAVCVFLLATATCVAAPVSFVATLTGADEFPANPSTGTGFGIVTLDTVAHTLQIEIQFSGLVGITTASHIHCCTANPGDISQTAQVVTQTPSFVGFPLGVTFGTYDNTFDTLNAATWRAMFLAGLGNDTAAAEAFLSNGLLSGTAYLNIHTTTYGGGEIRGFLVETPEPGTFFLGGVALTVVALARRNRRSRG